MAGTTAQSGRATTNIEERADAPLRTLRDQIKPHFLFNTLNAIAALIADDPKKAEEMIVRLAAFYRKSLEQDLTSNISLDEEFDVLGNYVDIEEVRFEGQLGVDLELAEDCRNVLVPALILQPIVENSIRYGLRSSGPLMSILVSAKRFGDRVRLTVDDDGRANGGDMSGMQRALSIVDMRLRRSFSDRFSLNAGPKRLGGYTVQIEIPAESPTA